MDDMNLPDDTHIELPVPAAVRNLSDSQKYALLALGGLALVALVLSSMARRRGVFPGRTPGSLEREVQISADWAASLRHFAAAVDVRMAGMQQQLDALHQAVGTEGPLPYPSETVSPNGTGPSSTSYEAAVADQPENVVPNPASTSLP